MLTENTLIYDDLFISSDIIHSYGALYHILDSDANDAKVIQEQVRDSGKAQNEIASMDTEDQRSSVSASE